MPNAAYTGRAEEPADVEFTTSFRGDRLSRPAVRPAEPALLAFHDTLTTVAPTPVDGDTEPQRPGLVAVIQRVSLSLLIAVVVPAVLFYGFFALAGVWSAIAAALAWSYGAIAWRAMTKRRASGLLILAALLLTGRTALSVVADSPWLYFLQPIISDGLVALLFLLSLASARPMVARLAGDFYPMDHELAARPRVRRLFRNLTIMWAALGLAKAATMLWLLQSQTLGTFVLVKSISMLTINVLAAFATIGLAAFVARKEGLMGSTRRVPVAA
jgi:hypothetical protein